MQTTETHDPLAKFQATHAQRTAARKEAAERKARAAARALGEGRDLSDAETAEVTEAFDIIGMSMEDFGQRVEAVRRDIALEARVAEGEPRRNGHATLTETAAGLYREAATLIATAAQLERAASDVVHARHAANQMTVERNSLRRQFSSIFGNTQPLPPPTYDDRRVDDPHHREAMAQAQKLAGKVPAARFSEKDEIDERVAQAVARELRGVRINTVS